jgi:hypothetical protein
MTEYNDDCPKFQVPENPDDEWYDLLFGLQTLVDKWPQYREARRKYKGEIDEFSSNLSIERMLKETSRLYRFNLAAVPVKIMRNRLKVGGIRVDDGSQDALDKIWSANDMEIWFPKMILTALKYGDAYARAWTVPEEDSEEDNDIQDAGVIVNLQHPMTTCVIYDEETQRKALYAVKYFQYGDRWRADLEYRDNIYHFITLGKDNRGLKKTDWLPYQPPYKVVTKEGKIDTEYAPEVEENTFSEISIKHMRTDLPYGVPLHIDAYGPQNAISKLLVTEMSVVDTQGWPARWALMDPDSVLDENHDTPNWGDDTSAGVDDGRAEVDSHVRNEPGATEIMSGIKQTGQYEAAPASVFIEPVELFVSLMATLTETPLYSFKPGGEQPSGKARIIADAPLEANKERLQSLFNTFLRDFTKFMLRIVGEPTKMVEVAWKPTILASDLDDWKVIAAKREEGVPFEVRMAEAGYDPQTIAKWLQAQEDFSLQEKIKLAAEIGEMIKNLSAAVQGGIIDEDTANGILKDVMEKLGFDIAEAPEPDPMPLMGGINPDGSAVAAGVPVRADMARTRVPAPGRAAASAGRPADQAVSKRSGQGGTAPGPRRSQGTG